MVVGAFVTIVGDDDDGMFVGDMIDGLVVDKRLVPGSELLSSPSLLPLEAMLPFVVAVSVVPEAEPPSE